MEEIRGKTLKEWKDYCKNDNVPMKTMKYIACLDKTYEAITVTPCCTDLGDKPKLNFVKSFYCYEELDEKLPRCEKQCVVCRSTQKHLQ